MFQEIKIFQPWTYEKQALNLKSLNEQTGREFQYAALGRASFYHLLKALGVKDKILIPTYICDSILQSLTALNIQPVYYDIDPQDLNGSLESVKVLSDKYSVKAVLVASLYGNPADMTEIEKFCQEKGIILIDDGAQSFGAKIGSRFISTFGDGGFFSFSPGKPTAAPMGSFFWTKNKYEFSKTNSAISHHVKFLNFYFNRLHIYEYKWLAPFKYLLRKLDRFLDKINNHFYDRMEAFEEEILGGVLELCTSRYQSQRQDLIGRANQIISSRGDIARPLLNVRGISNSHKIVWIFKNSQLAQDFYTALVAQNVFCLLGYRSLGKNKEELPQMTVLEGRVLEIPMEQSKTQMDFLFSTLKKTIQKF